MYVPGISKRENKQRIYIQDSERIVRKHMHLPNYSMLTQITTEKNTILSGAKLENWISNEEEQSCGFSQMANQNSLRLNLCCIDTADIMCTQIKSTLHKSKTMQAWNMCPQILTYKP